MKQSLIVTISTKDFLHLFYFSRFGWGAGGDSIESAARALVDSLEKSSGNCDGLGVCAGMCAGICTGLCTGICASVCAGVGLCQKLGCIKSFVDDIILKLLFVPASALVYASVKLGYTKLFVNNIVLKLLFVPACALACASVKSLDT